jgi:malonyl-CoA/methylmalonyl-CoA synthetase
VVLKSRSRLSSQKIEDRCRQKLMNWKCPKKILIMKELPKNRMGKVLRDQLKDLFVADNHMIA